MSKAILNYTTSIDFDKTISEIQKCLREHGASKITCDYRDNLPIGMTFCLVMNEKIVAFSLPCNYEGVLKAMINNKNVPRAKCTMEQAMRVSWRIVKDWVEAQMAVVEAQVACMDQVFLPYAVTNRGTTVYEEMKNNDQFLLNSD